MSFERKDAQMNFYPEVIPFENVPAVIKWGAFSRLSFRPISARGSIETTTMRKTHPTLVDSYLNPSYLLDQNDRIFKFQQLGFVKTSDAEVRFKVTVMKMKFLSCDC